jgi:hypothetical protein
MLLLKCNLKWIKLHFAAPTLATLSSLAMNLAQQIPIGTS